MQRRWLFILSLLLFGYYATAQNRLADSLLNELNGETEEISRLKLLKQLSGAWKQKNSDSSFYFANQMLALARKKQNNYYIADAHELLSNLYHRQNNHKKAVLSLDSARYYSFYKLKDDNSVIYYDILLGSTYLSTGNYSNALENFIESLEIARKIKRYDKVVASYNNIGAVYYYLGDDQTALDYFLKSYEIRIKHGLTKNMAFSLNNIGAIYSKYNEHKKALEYHLKALEISKRDGDKYSMLKALTNLGDDYGKHLEYSKSIQYYHKALKLSDALNDTENRANILSKMGNIYFENGNKMRAVEMVNKAVEISYNIDYKYGITSFSADLGNMYVKLGELKKAKPLLNTALNVARQINASREIVVALNYLSKYYYQKKNMYRAYNYRLQYDHLRDSLKVAETNLRIANLKNGFELNRKLDEIKVKQNELNVEKKISRQRLLIIYLIGVAGALLLVFLWVTIRLYNRIKEKNKHISEKNAQISGLLEKEQETNKIKDTLISTISHEFRTPLAIISTNVQMIIDMGDQMDMEMKEETAGFVSNSISNLTEMLNNFTILDKKKLLVYNPVIINPAEYIKQLVNELNTLPEYNNRIVLKLKPGCEQAKLDKSLIRHVVRNLLVNALKFSEEKVTLMLESKNNTIVIEVSDKGIGIPEEDISKIFGNFYRASNAKFTKGTGMGMSVVQRCIKLMSGKVEINSKKGVGTNITVMLPCNSNNK